jgi:hypothetical protein
MDLIYNFFDKKKENDLERDKCQRDYYEHKCELVTAKDGPILNDYCREREKCMTIDYERVYFHSVLVKYFKDVVNGLFFEVSYKNVLTYVCALLTLPLVIKILFSLM